MNGVVKTPCKRPCNDENSSITLLPRRKKKCTQTDNILYCKKNLFQSMDGDFEEPKPFDNKGEVCYFGEAEKVLNQPQHQVFYFGDMKNALNMPGNKAMKLFVNQPGMSEGNMIPGSSSCNMYDPYRDEQDEDADSEDETISSSEDEQQRKFYKNICEQRAILRKKIVPKDHGSH